MRSSGRQATAVVEESQNSSIAWRVSGASGAPSRDVHITILTHRQGVLIALSDPSSYLLQKCSPLPFSMQWEALSTSKASEKLEPNHHQQICYFLETT